jgi:hypothetical protein
MSSEHDHTRAIGWVGSHARYHRAVTARHLPGEDLVGQGIRDLRAGRSTVEALLVAIGATRLRAAGVDIPRVDRPEAEHRLYELLARDDPDSAHGRYNALIRRLVSYERAAEHAASREAGHAASG